MLRKALSDWQSSGHDDLLAHQIGWPLRNQDLTLLSPRKRWSAKERLVSAHPPSTTTVAGISFVLPSSRKRHGICGNLLNTIMSAAKANSSESSPETLKLIEQVLDHVRANLVNIRNTWGAESVQYKSAAEIMERYLDENTKRLKVAKPDLEELMKKMSLDG